MAKEVGQFEIIIRGTGGGGPTECFVHYQLQDASDNSLRAHPKQKQVSSPNFNKTLHNSGSVGEFWKDELTQVETDESL